MCSYLENPEKVMEFALNDLFSYRKAPKYFLSFTQLTVWSLFAKITCVAMASPASKIAGL